MQTLIRMTLMVLCLVALPILSQGCATGGSAAPSGPVELNGTRWKLVALAGRLDGRVVEFKKKGKDGYYGYLVDKGQRLREVIALQEGLQVFSMRKKGENQYEGVYKAISSDGSISERDVAISVEGNSLSWNQESAVWERVQ